MLTLREHDMVKLKKLFSSILLRDRIELPFLLLQSNALTVKPSELMLNTFIVSLFYPTGMARPRREGAQRNHLPLFLIFYNFSSTLYIKYTLYKPEGSAALLLRNKK